MGLMKKLTSAVVASSLVLGAVSTAFAAPAADEVNTAYARLNHYNVVQGVALPDGTVSPALEQDITRAQLITIVTRAFGQEANAKLLTGAKTGYADVDGNIDVEWATGYIFMGQRIAAQKGITIGLPGNLFAPSQNVTQIETLAFVMKFLGIEVGTGDTWVEDTLANAKAAGLLTDAEVAKFIDNANAPANRGHVFALLDSIFANYNKLEGGKTVYTAYIDSEAPELNVNAPALTTDLAAITVTGSVRGEFSGLFLGSEKITANADGTFSVEVPLEVGANDITLTVVDLAGNSDDYSVTVTRAAGAAAKITASLAGTIVAGSSADLVIEVTDANGVALEVPASEISVTVGGNVGTYADGKFTAAEKAGTGTVTVAYGDLTPVTVDVQVVAGELAQLIADKPSVAKGETIQLTPADKFGNPIASGVTYTAEGNGIAVTGAGTVYTSAQGKYTVTAKAGEATASTTIGVYGEVTGLKVSAPESITANGTTKKVVTVTAVDEFGNAVVGFDEQSIKLSGATIYKADGSAETGSAETEDGVATFQIAIDPAFVGEEVVLTATYEQDGDDITGETTVIAAAPVASALKVVSDAPKFLASNKVGEATVGVRVVDQEGVAFPEAYDVTATVTGPVELVSDTEAYNGSDAAQFTVTNYKTVGLTGAVTLTFSVEGVGSVSHTLNQVIAGVPAKIALSVKDDETTKKAGQSFTFTAEVQDANGVPVVLSETQEAQLTIELPEAEDLENVENIQINDGEAAVIVDADETSTTFTVSVESGKPFTGSLPVKAKYTLTDASTGKTSTIEGSKSVSFVPGDVTGIALTRENAIEAPVAAPNGTFTFYVSDAHGNAVPKADVELTVYGFEVVNGENVTSSNLTINGASDKTTVKTNAEGKATVELKARPYVGRTYVVMAESGEMKSEFGELSIQESVVGSIDTKLYKEVEEGKFIKATSVEAGKDFYVVATVKDNYGGLLPGVSLTGVADEVLGDVVGEQYGLTDSMTFYAHNDEEVADVAEALELEAGQYVAKVMGGKAGIVTIGAKYTGTQEEIAKTASISVKAGALETIDVVTEDDATEIKIKAGEVSDAVTIKLADAFGNAVSTTTSQKIEWEILNEDDQPAGSELTIRNSSTGATANSVSTKSAANIYLVGTTAGKTYTINFTSGDAEGTITVIVEE